MVRLKTKFTVNRGRRCLDLADQLRRVDAINIKALLNQIKTAMHSTCIVPGVCATV